MKISSIVLAAVIALFAVSAAESQTIGPTPRPSSANLVKLDKTGYPLDPKTGRRMVMPQPTVMAIEGTKVKVCSRDTKDGQVNPRNCRSAHLPPVVGVTVKHIEVDYLSNKDHTWIALENNKASLCRFDLKNRRVHCLPIPAPVPQGVDFEYVSLADNMNFMQFSPMPGVRKQDINIAAVNIFIKALNGTAKKTRSILVTANQNSLVIGANNNACYAEEIANGWCISDDPSDPEDAPQDPSSGDNDPIYDNGATDPWTEPDPFAADAPCIITPFGGICTVTGHRPPPVDPDTMPLPSTPSPWFPQSWCDFANIFCTGGQIPDDNDRGLDSSHSGKTLDELKDICYANLDTDILVCEANFKMHRDNGIFGACKERAWNRLTKCVETAKKVTDNGAHPAP